MMAEYAKLTGFPEMPPLWSFGYQQSHRTLASRDEILAQQFAADAFDTMRNAGDYERTLSHFASGQIQVMLGTQMIAKGLDYPNVTLVGVITRALEHNLGILRPSRASAARRGPDGAP